MTSSQLRPVTPKLVVPDGLQARADWEALLAASPGLPATDGSSSSPALSNHDYQPHDPRDCIHARILCEQRFATLETLFAELEEHCKRSQCRCAQSKWYRTKSFFGTVKKALSI
ncbi:hypothetical protein VTI74DRAFT_7142 [Chaetomium olivicolor]